MAFLTLNGAIAELQSLLDGGIEGDSMVFCRITYRQLPLPGVENIEQPTQVRIYGISEIEVSDISSHNTAVMMEVSL